MSTKALTTYSKKINIKILTIFNTHPKAIKMAPLIHTLTKNPFFKTKIYITTQHQKILNQILKLFSIIPNYNLNIIQPKQNLTKITYQILKKLKPILTKFKPNIILIHNNTTTTLTTNLTTFYQHIPINHIKTNLHTNNLYSP